MIVVAGTAPINPEKREEAKVILKTMMDATMQEDGCITYQFLFNPWDDAQVQIFEEWETQADLDAPALENFDAALRRQSKRYSDVQDK